MIKVLNPHSCSYTTSNPKHKRNSTRYLEEPNNPILKLVQNNRGLWITSQKRRTQLACFLLWRHRILFLVECRYARCQPSTQLLSLTSEFLAMKSGLGPNSSQQNMSRKTSDSIKNISLLLERSVDHTLEDEDHGQGDRRARRFPDLEILVIICAELSSHGQSPPQMFTQGET